jgi:hypothetical protein
VADKLVADKLVAGKLVAGKLVAGKLVAAIRFPIKRPADGLCRYHLISSFVQDYFDFHPHKYALSTSSPTLPTMKFTRHTLAHPSHYPIGTTHDLTNSK